MESIDNFRDFGGFPAVNGNRIRTGLLFRSGSLDKATTADLKLLRELGIRTVVDLRTGKERSGKPDRLWEIDSLQYIHLPVKTSMVNDDGPVKLLYSLLSGEIARIDFEALSTHAYREFITDFRPELAQVVKLTADPARLPLLIHCTAGKDRTGFACSLLQALLGVSWEIILADYMKSNDLLQEYRAGMLHQLRIFRIFGAPAGKFLPVFEARREYLAAAFELMDQLYGSAQEFAHQGLGITEEELGKLEAGLLRMR